MTARSVPSCLRSFGTRCTPNSRGRHGLYELNYAGNAEQKYLDVLHWAMQAGPTDEFKAMVDEFMSHYDLDGWTAPRGGTLDRG